MNERTAAKIGLGVVALCVVGYLTVIGLLIWAVIHCGEFRGVK